MPMMEGSSTDPIIGSPADRNKDTPQTLLHDLSSDRSMEMSHVVGYPLCPASEHPPVPSHAADSTGPPAMEPQKRPKDVLKRLKSIEDENEAMTKALAELNVQQMNVISLLKRIDDRQEEQDSSRKPMPEVSSTSASAWNPLLNSTMENIINPEVERWRGTLDTLLIFIALFSAIVTSFLVQAFEGLSQDSGTRTNELVANLTEIIIQLSRAPSSELNISQPALFEPEPSAVRQNVFWSLSLIVSLCIASLAVVGRSYLAALTRCRRDNSKADQKLVEIFGRWLQADRLLRPAVESLPQGLILAVAFFIIGLLDTLLSSAIFLLPLWRPILGAGILASALVGLSGAAIIFAFVHGCAHPLDSPFQSFISSYLDNETPYSPGPSAPCGTAEAHTSDALERKSPLTSAVYHRVLLLMHDDDSVDRAAAALWDLVKDLPLEQKGEKDIVDSLLYLLSPECSFRSNQTAALTLMKIEDYEDPNILKRNLIFSDVHRYKLSRALLSAIQREHPPPSSSNCRERLWNSTYAHALACLLGPRVSSHQFEEAPCLVLLLSDEQAFLEPQSCDCVVKLIREVKIEAQYILSRCLYQTTSNDKEAAANLLISLPSLETLYNTFPSYASFTTLIDFWTRQSYDVHSVINVFFRWLCRNKSLIFVRSVLDHIPALLALKDLRYLYCLLDAVAQYKPHYDERHRIDSITVRSMIDLIKAITRSGKAIHDVKYQCIIYIIRAIAKRNTWSKLLDDAAWIEVCDLLQPEAELPQDQPYSMARTQENHAKWLLIRDFQTVLQTNPQSAGPVNDVTPVFAIQPGVLTAALVSPLSPLAGEEELNVPGEFHALPLAMPVPRTSCAMGDCPTPLAASSSTGHKNVDQKPAHTASMLKTTHALDDNCEMHGSHVVLDVYESA